MANSDPKGVTGLVDLTFRKPQAQQGYVEDFGNVKSTKDVMQCGIRKGHVILLQALTRQGTAPAENQKTG